MSASADMKNDARSQPAAPLSNATILRGALIGGAINAVINGGIQWYLLRGETQIPLSVDGITNDTHTVLGAAVPLAVSLAMILTAIAYLTLKADKRPFFPHVLWLTIKHGVFAFGLIVSAAVVWQRTMGTVQVSLATAVIVLGLVAGLVTVMVNVMTIRASLSDRLPLQYREQP